MYVFMRLPKRVKKIDLFVNGISISSSLSLFLPLLYSYIETYVIQDMKRNNNKKKAVEEGEGENNFLFTVVCPYTCRPCAYIY